ncbi:16S rRNA (guanine(527)-N(7))-methyltransferase RsmG [Azorhizobium doebereinerae]|uniref:16S rRNA (guanine(527)-N(7))-methyltransferase RsmG n=1 Tax=Azorhizobium doebereinerae TaxID=281091 RepID=UPI000685EF29|nr:16S rRNA (guanine(527)-N(7))-methyltransferase RsmG [Azorhizobium doebereinerae]
MSNDTGRAAVAATVSRETLARLDLLAEQLIRWQKKINLVAPNTLPELWSRHIADSLQLVDHVPPDVSRWVDLGSGGGFPGLVVAAVLAERPGAQVTLVESDTRKAAFLREASRAAGLPTRIVPERIEQAAQRLAPGTQVVSARALAPLPKLLDLAAPFLAAGALGLFPKGRDWERELTDARKGWTLDLNLHRSLGDPQGRILAIISAERAAPAAGSPPGGEPSATPAAPARGRTVKGNAP